jgi:hypothetical protein
MTGTYQNVNGNVVIEYTMGKEKILVINGEVVPDMAGGSMPYKSYKVVAAGDDGIPPGIATYFKGCGSPKFIELPEQNAPAPAPTFKAPLTYNKK